MRILFLAHTPNTRVLRQAIALHNTGRHTLYLLHCTKVPLPKYVYRFVMGLLQGQIYRNRRLDADLLETVFECVSTYRNYDELRRVVQSVEADIIHAHAEPNLDVRIAMETVQLPVIFDPTDITSMRFDQAETRSVELEAERYCFAHAAGYVHKGPEVDYVRQMYHYNRPTLDFDNYCVDDWIVDDPLPKLSERDGEWHVTFAGNIAPLFFSRQSWGYKQFDGLAEVLGRQKIHLHLYGSPHHSVNSLASYRWAAMTNSYLHLHHSLPAQHIAREISCYDFGLWIHPRTDISRVQDWMWNTAIGNKFYTYLESGLPLILNDDLRYGAELVRKNDVGLVVSYNNLDSLDTVLAGTDVTSLNENVRSIRRDLTMSRHVGRLEAFYETVHCSH